MKEICEIPPRQRFEVTVVCAEQLHAHHSEYENNYGEHETQIAEGAHRTTDYADQQVQRRPRFCKFEDT